jgi:hypothetical protein
MREEGAGGEDPKLEKKHTRKEAGGHGVEVSVPSKGWVIRVEKYLCILDLQVLLIPSFSWSL